MPDPRAVYAATKKSPDLPWNRFVARPVAAVVVAFVQGTRITPNQITLATLVVALAAAVALVFWPGYWGLVAAIVVYEFSYVLDCADGMLARWRKIQSEQGHLLDFLMDELKAFLMLAAVSVRLFLGSGESSWLLWGIAGLVCLASGTTLTTFLRRPEVRGPSREPDPKPPSALKRPLGLVESLGKLLIHYPSYIWLAALVGRIEYFLYPYVAVNLLYSAKTLMAVALRFGRERRVNPR